MDIVGTCNNILSKSGAWFKYGEDVKNQGRENLRDMFEKDMLTY